jgi:uncharacterized protein (DUF2062 family)
MAGEAFWPRGGWTRAFHYVKHRIRRLPDDPRRIARGVGAGVFISFTPFFGFHFIGAALIAKLTRGNILAALLGTFFGNPLTTPIIAVSSLKFGNWMLGTRFDDGDHASVAGRFIGAAEDLKHNFFAIFGREVTHWDNLVNFWNDIVLPYLIGGFIPGIVAAVICYYLSEPLISAYQKHRRKKLKERFEKLKARLHARAEESH